jgi:hypothetical protein
MNDPSRPRLNPAMALAWCAVLLFVVAFWVAVARIVLG